MSISFHDWIAFLQTDGNYDDGRKGIFCDHPECSGGNCRLRKNYSHMYSVLEKCIDSGQLSTSSSVTEISAHFEDSAGICHENLRGTWADEFRAAKNQYLYQFGGAEIF